MSWPLRNLYNIIEIDYPNQSNLISKATNTTKSVAAMWTGPRGTIHVNSRVATQYMSYGSRKHMSQ